MKAGALVLMQQLVASAASPPISVMDQRVRKEDKVIKVGGSASDRSRPTTSAPIVVMHHTMVNGAQSAKPSTQLV